MGDRLEISEETVARLIAHQFPQWAGLAVRRIVPGGWDNLSFRLGDTMSVRMPSARRYAAQVEKEQRHLPQLAPHLPLAIPTAIATGAPADDYPFPFGLYGWIDGRRSDEELVADHPRFARDLARFLSALHRIETSSGPPAGEHNFFRGGDLAIYDDETRAAVDALRGVIDTRKSLAIWERALGSRWQHQPVWVHGDIASGNLLTRDGRLFAVIDFGTCGTGDPSCDLVIAWTFLDEPGRRAFREALPMDEETWQRARGWALWKALITLARQRETSDAEAAGTQALAERIISTE